MARKQRLTNAEIGQYYWQIIQRTRNVTEPFFMEQRKRIGQAKVRIHAHWQKHGNLDQLKIPGVGVETKAIIQEILEQVEYTDKSRIVSVIVRRKSTRPGRKPSAAYNPDDSFNEAGPWQEQNIRILEDG